MKKSLIILFVVFALGNVFAQVNNFLPKHSSRKQISSVRPIQTQYQSDNNASYDSRFLCFAYFYGLCKGFLNSPETMEVVDLSQYYYIYGAAMIPGTGVIYAINREVSGVNTLCTIDTTTGGKTIIAEIQNPFGGQGLWFITGIAWDKTTNQMFAFVIPPDGVSRLCTINLSTGVLTPIAEVTGMTSANDIAINNEGIIYCASYNPGTLYTLNKTTGAATAVGLLGYNLQSPQGMAFDPSTDSLYFAAYFPSAPSGLFRCNTSTGALTLVGNFPNNMEVDGLIIPDKSAQPLTPFSLQSPVNATRIVTAHGSTTPVTLSWDNSAYKAGYKFIFGSPTTATRRITLPVNKNTWTTTLGVLDSILASGGFTNNGSASDSAVGQWDVWAFKGAGASGVDSLKSNNGPRQITFRRQPVTLAHFGLISPAAGTTITTSASNSAQLTFNWNKSGNGGTYKWLFKNALTYSDPAFLRLSSGNSLDTFLTLTYSKLDSILSDAGIAPGDSVKGIWRVRVYSGSDSVSSNAPDRQITLKRAFLPLNQNFSTAVFPPPYWQTEFTGTPYWLREPNGSFGNNIGEACFDYWSAPIGTTQSLISNIFPGVTNSGNYLRFNYAHAIRETPFVDPDSLAIYTSIDAGLTWSRLICLYSSSTIQIGVNSTTNFTTARTSQPFTLPMANQWATKIFQLPVGTNRVKFTAYCGDGNFGYFDDITTGTPTGENNNSISLIPDKMQLSQNYPNPFNPTTKINFSIPTAGFVSLKVYDIVGREVKTLVSNFKNAGTYSVNFDGSGLSSGIYFYEMNSGDFSDKKRMVLIK